MKSIATTAERLGRGDSVNPVIKTQNDMLRKLQACTSLLQSSVLNISINLSSEAEKEDASCPQRDSLPALIFPLIAPIQFDIKVNRWTLCISSSERMHVSDLTPKSLLIA